MILYISILLHNKKYFNNEENSMHETEVKGILSAKNGMNIYRGCTHGCIYCDSRSKCYQMHHDFEDIEVKINLCISDTKS